MPRVRNITQYQWRDEPVVARGGGPREYAGWQSGLRYVNDRPKPAFRVLLSKGVYQVSGVVQCIMQFTLIGCTTGTASESYDVEGSG